MLHVTGVTLAAVMLKAGVSPTCSFTVTYWLAGLQCKNAYVHSANHCGVAENYAHVQGWSTAAMGQTKQEDHGAATSRQLPGAEGQQKAGYRGRKAAAEPSSIAAVLAAHGHLYVDSQHSSSVDNHDSDCT